MRYHCIFYFLLQIEELTTALVQERQNNAHLQQENVRLEEELESTNARLAEVKEDQSRAESDLRELVRPLFAPA